MLHPAAEEGTPGPFGRRALTEDLEALGLRRGDTVIVHCSLRSLGWTIGGGVALLVALRDALGPQGTVVVPTFTTYLCDPATWVRRRVPEEWWPRIRASLPPFDPEVHPAQPSLGRFPELVRACRTARRSAHPLYSFAALGPAAQEVLAPHPLDYGLGAGGPLGALLRLNARVLLLGVGWDKATLLHLPEHLTDFRGRRSHVIAVPEAGADGATRWRETTQLVMYEGDFPAVADSLRGAAAPRLGRVGAAEARLCEGRPLVDAACLRMARHRDFTRSAMGPHLVGIAPAPAAAL